MHGKCMMGSYYGYHAFRIKRDEPRDLKVRTQKNSPAEYLKYLKKIMELITL